MANSMREVEWGELSQACAFLGNSLLAPMAQTANVGADPAFWEAFPDFGDARVTAACEACAQAARGLARRAQESGRDAVELASTEFTRLFIGPPSPAAAPWESFYRSQSDNPVGFGEATHQMRELLRAAGLEVRNENNQYADHIGLELLFLSELARRRAQGAQAAADGSCTDEAILAFVREHPLGWISSLRAAVDAAFPGGYVSGVLGVAASLLEMLEGRLAA